MGKRTRQGMFDDGVNSAKRYFINNLKDPIYQKAIDILLGKLSDEVTPVLRDLRTKAIEKLKVLTPKKKLKSGFRQLGTRISRVQTKIARKTLRPYKNTRSKRSALQPAIKSSIVADVRVIDKPTNIDGLFEDLLNVIREDL